MLACLLGESKDIFFPKLGEEQMMTFSTIAELFLTELGLSVDYCASEQEAKEKAARWSQGDTSYPVYLFKSDTSGEKMYEEFYTTDDRLDLDSFGALGIIKNAEMPAIDDVENMLVKFKELFDQNGLEKTSVINLLSTYLSDFKHIETGKSLDSRM